MLTSFNKSICVELASAENDNCRVLQRGVNITVELSGTSDTYGYYYDFNYSATEIICIEYYGSDRFEKARSGRVIINSVSYYTTVTAGIITRIGSDNDRFIDAANSKFDVSGVHLCLHGVVNRYMAQNFDEDDIVNATLTITHYYGSGTDGNQSYSYVHGESDPNIINYDSTAL